MCLPQGGWRSSTPPSPYLPNPSQQDVPLQRPVALLFSFIFTFIFFGGGGTYPSSANMGSRQSLVLRSVWFAVVLGALQLHLQPLHADLEAVHRLDGCLCRHWIVIADKACRGRQTQKRACEKQANGANGKCMKTAGRLLVFIWRASIYVKLLHLNAVMINVGCRTEAEKRTPNAAAAVNNNSGWNFNDSWREQTTTAAKPRRRCRGDPSIMDWES